MGIEILRTHDGLQGLVHHPEDSQLGGCVVVVHGAASDCFDGLVWDVCQEVAAAGFRCAAVNLSARGLGRYADSLRKYRGWPWASTNEAIAEVAAVADRCASEFGGPVYLLGHSWGALIAAFACSVIAPARIVLVSPMPSGTSIVDTLYAHPELALAEARDLVASGGGAALLSTESPGATALSAETLLDFYERKPNGIEDALSELDLPIHVIVGSREHPALIAAARELADRGAHSQLTVVNGAGHFYVGRRRQMVDALTIGL